MSSPPEAIYVDLGVRNAKHGLSLVLVYAFGEKIRSADARQDYSACIGCHGLFSPLSFLLQNFNASVIGEKRACAALFASDISAFFV